METFEHKGFVVSRKLWRDRWNFGVYWPAVMKTTAYTALTADTAKSEIDRFIEKGGKPVSEIHNEYSHLHWGVMEMMEADKEKDIISEDFNQFIWKYMLMASRVTDDLIMSYENIAMMIAFWEMLFPNQAIIEKIGTDA